MVHESGGVLACGNSSFLKKVLGGIIVQWMVEIEDVQDPANGI